MKTIEQYTDSELLEMDYEKTQSLIELQCAIDGVPLLPSHPECPTKPEIEGDKIIYVVSLGYSDIGSFATKEAAQVVADAINAGGHLCMDYDYFGGKKIETIKSDEPSIASTSMKKCLSPELMASSKEALNKYKEDSALYDDLMAAYNEASTARESSISIVEDIIRAAYQRDYNRKDAMQKYEHYLNLSDGDVEIAMKFFDSNYSGLREFLPTSITTPTPVNDPVDIDCCNAK